MEGERKPHWEILPDGSLWINGRRAESFPSWDEWDVPREELYRRAFEEQRQTLQHNRYVDAFHTVVCTVAVGAVAAFVTLHARGVGRR